jgi:hypothetical protein
MLNRIAIVIITSLMIYVDSMQGDDLVKIYNRIKSGDLKLWGITSHSNRMLSDLETIASHIREHEYPQHLLDHGDPQWVYWALDRTYTHKLKSTSKGDLIDSGALYPTNLTMVRFNDIMNTRRRIIFDFSSTWLHHVGGLRRKNLQMQYAAIISSGIYSCYIDNNRNWDKLFWNKLWNEFHGSYFNSINDFDLFTIQVIDNSVSRTMRVRLRDG